MPRSCSDAFYFHLVYEYLVHMGMDSTSRRMLEECDVYGYPIPYLSEMGVSMEEISKLLQNFDEENCMDFFRDFEMAVPVNIQSTTDFRKLKLGLHVYFAITGLQYEKDVPSDGRNGSDGGKAHTDRPNHRDNHDHRSAENSAADSDGHKNCTTSCPCKNPHCMCRADGGAVESKANMKSKKYGKAEGRPEGTRQLAHPCMATLLAFLEKDGSELSKEPELLPYFALPFILDPEAHPHYEHLFKPPWASNLRRWLWNFLISHRQASRVPELVLLLPDLHSALSGRAGRTISSMGPRIYSSCPSSSDHEICMNHVISSAHGKQRIRQYYPAKDSNSRQIETSSKEVPKEAEGKPGNFGNSPHVSDSFRKPVTFQPRDHRDFEEETEGTAGRPTQCVPSSDDGNSHRELDDACNQSCVLYGSLKSRYNQLHNDYHNLLGVAAELTDALEGCVRGENIDLTKTLENCSMLFPELIKMQEQFNVHCDESNSKTAPLQTTENDPQAPQQATSQTFRQRAEQSPKPVTSKVTSEHTTREVIVIAEDSPDISRTGGNETLHITTSATTPLKQNKARFDHDRTTKSIHDAPATYIDNVNPFCTSTMIPLYLMQNSEKTRTYVTCDLNFKAVKHDLYVGSVKRMLLLLQALRWRLTGTSTEQRMSAIESYATSDLLAILPCQDPASKGEMQTVGFSEQTSLLERLLMPCSVKSPHPLQQASSRLINAIASIRKGRSYLVRSASVVDVHVRTLYQAELDTITSEMVIATLQKLSLRQSQRSLMIESNLVEWVVDQISVNINNRSIYWLKYTAALLMNLCLHTEARERCVPSAKKTLESIVQWMRATMVDMPTSSLSPPAAVLLPYIQNSEGKLHSIPRVRMAHISPKALPYLNGVVYTLISHPEINQAATEIGLAKTLQELIVVQDDVEVRCQLGHILTLHLENLLADPPIVSLQLNEDVEDGKWVLDLLEDELDAADPVQAGPNDLSGEQLLCRYYSILDADSRDTLNTTQQTETAFLPLDEGQLPLRSKLSGRIETRQTQTSATPVTLSPEIPECQWASAPSLDAETQAQLDRSLRNEQPETLSTPRRISVTLPETPSSQFGRPLTPEAPPPESVVLPEIPSQPHRPLILPEAPPSESLVLPGRTCQPRRPLTLPETDLPARANLPENICIAIERLHRSQIHPPEIASSIHALPIITPKESSIASAHPRTSVIQPISPRTSVIQPQTPPKYPRSSMSLPQSIFFPPKISINLPEVTEDWTKPAIVIPETKTPRNRTPRTSIAQPECPEEAPKTAVVLPETSSVKSRGSVPLTFQETAPSCPISNTVQSNPRHTLSNTSLSLDPTVCGTSDALGTQANVAATEGISTFVQETDSRFECEENLVTICFTKEEHVVRCRTPENIEVIVAVTLSAPDCVPFSEDERPEHIIRKYKKLVNKIRSPQKEKFECPSKSRETEHLSDKSENNVITIETIVNKAVPADTDSSPGPRSPKVCGIWSSSDLASGAQTGSSKSSRQEDSKRTKDSIFGSRPRLSRTPPNDSRNINR